MRSSFSAYIHHTMKYCIRNSHFDLYYLYSSTKEFQTAIIIDNKNILQLEKPLEILRAGIIDNEPMLKTPWGDKRLADKAVNK